MFTFLAGKSQKPITSLLIGIIIFNLGFFWLDSPSKAAAANWLPVSGASVLPGSVVTTFEDDPNVAYLIDNQGRIISTEFNNNIACSGTICPIPSWSKWTWVSYGLATPGATLTTFTIKLWSKFSYKYITRHFLFVIGTDGRAWYTEKTGYLTYTSWLSIGTRVLGPTSKIVAVQLGSNHISLFAIEADAAAVAINHGQIGFSGPINWLVYDWYTDLANPMHVNPSSPLTAVVVPVPNQPGNSQVFLFINSADSIYMEYSASLNEDNNPFIVYGFSGWWPLKTYFPISTSFTPISAVVRALDPSHPNVMTFDLTYAGSDGRIYTPRGTLDFNTPNPVINWLPSSTNPLPTGLTEPRTQVSILVSAGNRLDLFMVGWDGRVWTTTGTEGPGGLTYSSWQLIDGVSVPLNNWTPVRVIHGAGANYATLFLAMPGGDGGTYVTSYEL